MAHEQWDIMLEAYLDDELDPTTAAAFEAATAEDPELTAILQERREFKASARRALDSDLPSDLAALASGFSRQTAPATRTRRDRRWTLMALAAVLTLAILAPQMLRNFLGAEGPRSTITTGGSVIAIRYGEQADAAVDLEAGCYHLTTGACR